MTGLWRLEGVSAKQFAGRVFHEIQNDDVFGYAAQLSFYFLLALFPLLLIVTDLFGYFAQGPQLRASLLDYFQRVLPGSAFELVVHTLDQITLGAGGGKLSIGIIATVWAASNGMSAICDGLNAAYEVKDSRPWWKAKLLALGLTVAFSVFTVVAMILVMLGGKLGEFLGDLAGYQQIFKTAWDVVHWPIAIFIVLFAVNLLYRFAPDLHDWEWTWMTPGAVVAVSLWILMSLGFRFYLRFFNTYNATYGSLGAVIILLLWFYITGAAILIGAEVNSEIENAAAQSGDKSARLPGEKRPGEKRGLGNLGWLKRHRPAAHPSAK
jgi:membrane protein